MSRTSAPKRLVRLSVGECGALLGAVDAVIRREVYMGDPNSETVETLRRVQRKAREALDSMLATPPRRMRT